ncbi:hypothetical protein KJ590_03160 [Patescibacteria group bacterium]|nr:hypothetical protein [Patescibacteria group bacterium]MBU4142974.1 hypothetical protein [Patescibacteria group bacterium]
MGASRYCPNCGFIFHGQRTGKCPNCDGSALTKNERFYPINPAAIRQFKKFDKKGGDVSSLRFHNKDIALIETSPKGEWVSLSVLGVIITFADYGKGPQIIVDLPNNDGFGSRDIPEKLLTEAAQIASSIMKEY